MKSAALVNSFLVEFPIFDRDGGLILGNFDELPVEGHRNLGNLKTDSDFGLLDALKNLLWRVSLLLSLLESPNGFHHGFGASCPRPIDTKKRTSAKPNGIERRIIAVALLGTTDAGDSLREMTCHVVSNSEFGVDANSVFFIANVACNDLAKSVVSGRTRQQRVLSAEE